jgi:hypothetical protein
MFEKFILRKNNFNIFTNFSKDSTKSYDFSFNLFFDFSSFREVFNNLSVDSVLNLMKMIYISKVVHLILKFNYYLFLIFMTMKVL